jgi:Tol biopolymer transport system component
MGAMNPARRNPSDATLAQLLVLFIGAATLALAACGNANTSSTTGPSPLEGVTATSPSGTATPSVSPTGPGTIAFVKVTGSGSDIYTIRSDGTGLRRLTNTPENENMASWSPDGSKIAFVRWLGKKGGRYAGVYDFWHATIWVMDADGSHQQRLTPPRVKGAYGPSWSPDGRRILFGKYEGNYTWNLALMDADGSGLKKLTHDPAPRIMGGWSPDGRIFYNDGPGLIYAMNLDGSGLKAIADGPGCYSISPDGKWLAIAEHNAGQLLLAPASGQGAEETLIEDVSPYVRGGIVATSWSPDGRAIAFAADFNGDDPSALYILTTDGSVTKVPNTGKVMDPAWRPQ